MINQKSIGKIQNEVCEDTLEDSYPETNITMIPRVLCVMLISQSWLLDVVANNCGNTPLGQVACVDFSKYGYIGKQWATCLTNDYIVEKSQHRHHCRPREVTHTVPSYCFYQCQLEVNGQNTGVVTGKCKCDDFDRAPNRTPKKGIYDVKNNNWMNDLFKNNNYQYHTAPTTEAPLPDWCASPDGTRCSWFESCLNKKIPCSPSENDYVLEFTSEVCKLKGGYYGRNIGFSMTGHTWVEAVRKCLQVALVPQMRPWEKPTCLDIKREALSAQEACYLAANPEAPSICDVTCFDWAQFFWTVKSRGANLKKLSYIEVLENTVNVMSTCGKNVSIVGNACPTQMVRLTLNSGDDLYNMPGQRGERNKLAGATVKELAKRQDWDGHHMAWFAYSPSNVTDEFSSLVTINILLGDILGNFNLTKVVEDLFDSLKHGRLYDLAGKDNQASVATLELCWELLCQEVSMNATAGPRPPKPKALKSNSVTNLQVTFAAIWLCGVIAILNLNKT